MRLTLPLGLFWALQDPGSGKLNAFYYNQLAVEHLSTNPQKALGYAWQALEAAVQSSDSATQAKALANIGSAHFQLSQYDQALVFYLKALAVNQKIGNWKGESSCYNNIGNVYLYQSRYQEAVEFYENSLRMDELHGDQKGVAGSLHNIATVYSYFNPDQALQKYQEALRMVRQIRDTLSESMILNNIGSLYLDRREYDKSLTYFAQCLRINHQLRNDEGVATNLENMGKAYRGKRQYTKAIDYLKQSSTVAKQFTTIQQDNHQYLAEIYQETGDYQQALTHYKQFISLRDSAFNQETTTQLNELQTRFETAQKEKQIGVQQAELSRKSILVYTSATIAVLILGLAGIVYNRYRLKSKANSLLAAANAEIRQSVAEKEVLLQEIHHRVKNNLQLVSSLLTWQSSRITDERMLAVIEESKIRIRSMAQIHEYLYRSENLSQVNVQSYLENVLDSLAQSYRSDKAIGLQKEIEPVSLLADEAIPLGLIVNELVSNAFKYAFAERNDGTIRVSFREENQQYGLCISDDGIGLPVNASEKTATSLGLQLVRMLTRQLNGTLTVNPRPGASFHITFPVS